MLSDEEMVKCVQKAYFPMFKTKYLPGGSVLKNENVGLGEGQKNQPQVIGYFYDKEQGEDFDKLKVMRTALKRFSKDLYGDPHAWFEDFENYFREQMTNEENE